MTDPDPAAATAAVVYAVSLKLPTFLASRPDVWFKQTEAQFALRNITDSTTKYFYLLTSLDPVVTERMAGDVAAVPTDGKYEYLKSKLMEVYGLHTRSDLTHARPVTPLRYKQMLKLMTPRGRY